MTDLTNLIRTDLERGQTTKEVTLSGGLLYRFSHGRTPHDDVERVLIYRVYPEEASISEANTFINHTRVALEQLYGGQWLVKRSNKQEGTTGIRKGKRRVVGYTITWSREENAGEQENLI